jgi:hypothetical protein
MDPVSLRSLSAIHLATAALFGDTLSGVITYDNTMAGAAEALGWKVSSPR